MARALKVDARHVKHILVKHVADADAVGRSGCFFLVLEQDAVGHRCGLRYIVLITVTHRANHLVGIPRGNAAIHSGFYTMPLGFPFLLPLREITQVFLNKVVQATPQCLSKCCTSLNQFASKVDALSSRYYAQGIGDKRLCYTLTHFDANTRPLFLFDHLPINLWVLVLIEV